MIFAQDWDESPRYHESALELYKAVRDLETCQEGAISRTQKAMSNFRQDHRWAEDMWQYEKRNLTKTKEDSPNDTPS